MDPNETLGEAMKLANYILSKSCGGKVSQHDAVALAEKMHALNRWMENGGFMPNAWEKNR